MEPDLKLILDRATQPDIYKTNWDDGYVREDSYNEETEIWVWHQVLCNVSPYFRKLLAPGRFAEGVDFHENKKSVLKLPDTDARAMKILCDIFHHKTNKVPPDLNIRQLFHISVLADKFDCVESLQMWIPIWMDQDQFRFQRIVMMGKEPQDLITKWLCICLNLKYNEPVTELRNAFIVHSSQLDRDRERNPFIDHLPKSFTDDSETTHRSAVTELHELMAQVASSVQRGTTCQLTRLTEDLTGSSSRQYYEDLQLIYQCRSTSLGNFEIACDKFFGSNWETNGVWDSTIQCIVDRLRSFAQKSDGPKWLVRTDCANGALPTIKSHAACSLKKKMLEGIQEIADSHNLVFRDEPHPWYANGLWFRYWT